MNLTLMQFCLINSNNCYREFYSGKQKPTKSIVFYTYKIGITVEFKKSNYYNIPDFKSVWEETRFAGIGFTE